MQPFQIVAAKESVRTWIGWPHPVEHVEPIVGNIQSRYKAMLVQCGNLQALRQLRGQVCIDCSNVADSKRIGTVQLGESELTCFDVMRFACEKPKQSER